MSTMLVTGCGPRVAQIFSFFSIARKIEEKNIFMCRSVE
jgi:hypothetical protein